MFCSTNDPWSSWCLLWELPLQTCIWVMSARQVLLVLKIYVFVTSLVWQEEHRDGYGQFNQSKFDLNAPFNPVFLDCKHLAAFGRHCSV